MAMELKRYKLGEIVDFNKCSISKSESIQDIIYLDTSSITENVIGETVALNITEAPSRAQRKVTNNTIIYSTVRPRLKHYGILSNPKYNFIVSTGFVTIDLKDAYKDKIDPRYLYLLLTQPIITEYVGNIADTAVSAYPSINSSDLLSLSFNFPSYDTQKTVADIWANYDRKIALNRAINHNLEALAKQLYDYWFVQFDFPNEEGKPYKSSGGKMVWNEKLKREIPEGWEVVGLDNSFQVVSDKAKKDEIQHLLYAPIEVLPRKKMSFYDTAPIENAVSGLCKFEKGNILLSNRRVYFHKVCIAPFDGVTRNTVIILKTLNKRTFGFDYQIINSDHFISYATKFSYGSEQPVLSWQEAKNYSYTKPNNEIAEKYSNYVAPLINQVLEVQNELRELTKQRDELLPLLMNGQVSVNSD